MPKLDLSIDSTYYTAGASEAVGSVTCTKYTPADTTTSVTALWLAANGDFCKATFVRFPFSPLSILLTSKENGRTVVSTSTPNIDPSSVSGQFTPPTGCSVLSHRSDSFL